MTTSDVSPVFPVGLEEGPDGAVLVHSLSVPGCVAWGPTRDDALDAFARQLGEWLSFLQARGRPVPPPGAELEIAVDDWVTSDADVAAGESRATFESDLTPISEDEIAEGLQRLGALRGVLLAQLRAVRDDALERPGPGGWSPARILDELARAQWWTLTRLGASPLGEVPDRVIGRLDTAMALVVQHLTALDAAQRARVIEIDDETWTARKAMRRLLWLEWALGGSALHALEGGSP